jgi:hypothetical protein
MITESAPEMDAPSAFGGGRRLVWINSCPKMKGTKNELKSQK